MEGRKERTDYFQHLVTHVVPATYVEGQDVVLVVLHQLQRARGNDNRGVRGEDNRGNPIHFFTNGKKTAKEFVCLKLKLAMRMCMYACVQINMHGSTHITKLKRGTQGLYLVDVREVQLRDRCWKGKFT